MKGFILVKPHVYIHVSGKPVEKIAISKITIDLHHILNKTGPVNYEFYKSLGEDLCNELLEVTRKVRVETKRSVPSLADSITRGWNVLNPVTLENEELMSVIIYLNDSAKWTREQIADWIDTLPDQPKWRLLDNVQEQKPRIRF